MRVLVCSATVLVLCSTSTAQDQGPAQIAGGLEIGIPIGEFDAAWGRQMAGLSANVSIPMRRLPFYYGFDFGWSHMGGSSDVVAIDEENVESTEGELSVRSNIYGYHGLVRLQPFHSRVSPYVEGMVGLRHFATRSEIEVEGLDQPIMEQRNESDFIASRGWAAGVQVATGRSGAQSRLLFELRVERLDGGQVTYVDAESIAISPEGEVQYGTLTSGSRVVNITFGIGLRF